VVTSPKKDMAAAAREAADCIAAGGGLYFRSVKHYPTKLNVGDRIWYVEDGYLRGYASIVRINYEPATCATTGRVYEPTCKIWADATTWTWIKPIRFAGFRGYRYFDRREHKIKEVGGWLDPKPKENA
jgi:hypothetical protein